MKSAVLEKEPEAAAPAPKPRFEMPRPVIGTKIHFWVDADTKHEPHVGFVIEVSAGNITCKTCNRTGPDTTHYSVSHRLDPILENPERRKLGCWEFHTEVLRLAEVERWLEELETRPGGTK